MNLFAEELLQISCDIVSAGRVPLRDNAWVFCVPRECCSNVVRRLLELTDVRGMAYCFCSPAHALVGVFSFSQKNAMDLFADQFKYIAKYLYEHPHFGLNRWKKTRERAWARHSAQTYIHTDPPRLRQLFKMKIIRWITTLKIISIPEQLCRPGRIYQQLQSSRYCPILASSHMRRLPITKRLQYSNWHVLCESQPEVCTTWPRGKVT